MRPPCRAAGHVRSCRRPDATSFAYFKVYSSAGHRPWARAGLEQYRRATGALQLLADAEDCGLTEWRACCFVC